MSDIQSNAVGAAAEFHPFVGTVLDGQAIAAGADPFKDHADLKATWEHAPGFLGWLTSVDHKDIGMRYICTAMFFFFLSGLLAMAMRVQLAFPELNFLSADCYNQIFTTHGTTMMFLFAVPVMQGMGIYLVPLMLGTRNVSFPRLNAYGYFTYLCAGLLLYGGLVCNIGPDAGWFSYVPLAGPEFSPGKRVDFWSQTVSLSEIGSLAGAVVLVTTILKQRAPGMSLNRMPLFVWAMLITSCMILFAMPAVMLGTNILAADRLTNVNTNFFNQAEGGDALLWQHIFWFFGHPEVYIIFIPGTAFISTILPVFCRRPIFGYTAMVLALISIAFIGFGLWVHHMFATPIPRMGEAFFTAASMMIAVPNGLQIFCWIATLWSGRPRFPVPMLFVVAFIVIFVLGGLSGMMLASVSIDRQVHDTYFVVAHFHYVLIGGAVFPLFGAIYYWFPKWCGCMMSEKLGKWNFWLFFIGFNMTFFPMHILGIHGMPRRIYTYLPETGWGHLNQLASLGTVVMFFGLLFFLYNVLWSRKHGKVAGANPWNADTLEWATSSPPPVYNFLYLRAVEGRSGLWVDTETTPVVTGLCTTDREVLSTTILEAAPEHRYSLCEDSIWPLCTSAVTGAFFLAVIFTPWAVPIAAAAAFITLAFWFWRENEPAFVTGKASRSKEKKKQKAAKDSAHQIEASSLEAES